jgi:hypothetical protein
LSQDDRALFYDQANKKVLGAVAEISLVPLPPDLGVSPERPRPVRAVNAHGAGIRK